jgi:GTP-binding protein
LGQSQQGDADLQVRAWDDLGTGQLRSGQACLLLHIPAQLLPGRGQLHLLLSHLLEQRRLRLELKVLADVGLLGMPNAGKSTLISRISNARPKIADYPFTTLSPVLGTIEADDRQLVIADIPGLIEGASEGAGLGDEFLAHIERTRMLVHVLDLAPLDGSDPVENHATVEAELAAHDPRLAALPRILALSKSDLVGPDVAKAAAAEWAKRLGDHVPIVVTSAPTAGGIAELSRMLVRLVPEAAVPVEGIPEGRTIYRPAEQRGFDIGRDEETNVWFVDGPGIERLVRRFDLENEEALEEGLRILSCYRVDGGWRIYIITEADRSSTCILLPEEY